MHACDIIGYVVDGELYCPACAPRTDGDDCGPVFGGSETDYPSHCAACEGYLGESLTPDGVAYVLDALYAYARAGDGRPDILDAWRDDLSWYALDRRGTMILGYYDRARARDAASV